MTDPELVAKKWALVETCVCELRELSRSSQIPRDKVQQRFAEHTLRSRSRRSWTWRPTSSPTTTMRRMVGFRNILVHGYEIVDVSVLQEIVEPRLDDLLQFVVVIRARLT